MSDELGPITLGKKYEQVFLGRDLTRDRDFSEEIAKAIDKEIRRIVDRCYHRAEELIINNRSKLDAVAEALLERETLDAEEIAALIEGKTLQELQGKSQLEKEMTEEVRNNQLDPKHKRTVGTIKVVFENERRNHFGGPEGKLN